MKFYDKKNRRLAVFEEKATSKFWDKHWETKNLKREVESGKNNLFIKRITNRFLRPGAKILERGCGKGQVVYGLSYLGYDAYGVDYAEETVKKINENFPDLKIYFQNVENLKFSDNFFDGYWSLGVIEHSWEGYAKIIEKEINIWQNIGIPKK